MQNVAQTESIPNRVRAEAYLAEAARRNPGPWEAHSRYVALGAECIAARHPGLDPERAYILGLLHDVGRQEGVHGMRHVYDGYRFLAAEGYPGAARICLTHSFPVEGLVASADNHWDGAPEDYDFICRYLASIQYTDYDRLIQLCDSLALPSGFCLMEKRLIDVVMRYGFDEYTLPRWRGFFAVKERFETAIGGPVYAALPGVIENTFR